MAINRGLQFTSNVASGGEAHILDTASSYSSGTLLDLRNFSSPKFRVYYDGAAYMGRVGILQTPQSNYGAYVQTGYTALSGTSQYGVGIFMQGNSGATVQICGLTIQAATEAASFSCSQVAGVNVQDASEGAGSTITTQYGIKVENQTKGNTNYAIYTGTGTVRFGGELTVFPGGTQALRVEDQASLASGETSLWLYDKDNATLEQVTVGAADSGGSGFKVLRIPN